MTERGDLAIFWGEDAYLLREAASDFLEGSGLKPREIDARDWGGGETSDLATPSLWGERRALLVAGCESLPQAGLAELSSYLQAPSEDALCVLTLVSRAKNPPPLVKAVEKARGTVRHVSLRRQDLVQWVLTRARARGVRLSASGAAALVEVVGEDTAVLDRSVEQLGAAFPAKTIEREDVLVQFRGLGEQRIWDLCDKAFAGRAADALLSLRALLAGREEPLLILGGIASRLRDLIRVKSLPERMAPAEVARITGIRFDWRVRRYRDEARRLSLEDMTTLHDRVSDADRALKAGVPGDVVLAPLVAAVAGRDASVVEVPGRMPR